MGLVFLLCNIFGEKCGTSQCSSKTPSFFREEDAWSEVIFSLATTFQKPCIMQHGVKVLSIFPVHICQIHQHKWLFSYPWGLTVNTHTLYIIYKCINVKIGGQDMEGYTDASNRSVGGTKNFHVTLELGCCHFVHYSLWSDETDVQTVRLPVKEMNAISCIYWAIIKMFST